MVRLKKMSRQSLERHMSTPHRTRNALVAEYKNANVMTRNRLAVDQMKSPTRRVEHIRRVSSGLNRSEPSSPIAGVDSPRRRAATSGMETFVSSSASQSPNRTSNSRGTPRSTLKSTPNVSPTRPTVASTPTRNPTANRNASSPQASTSGARNASTVATSPTGSPKVAGKEVESKRTRQKNNATDTDQNANQSPPRRVGRPRLNINNNKSAGPAGEASGSQAAMSSTLPNGHIPQQTRSSRQLSRSMANDRPQRNTKQPDLANAKPNSSTTKPDTTVKRNASIQLPPRTTRTRDAARKTTDTTELRSYQRTRASVAVKK